MNLYFAPLEGITTYTYRNAHAEFFGGADSYFAPFITPTLSEKVGTRSFRDILPENNGVSDLKVQLLSNQADAFLEFSSKIKALGYDEINLNVGCPSSTVVKKGRGAGLLKDAQELDNFLSGIFEKSDLKISVKSRIGFWSGAEFEELTRIYNKYPIKKLIIHPRVREDYYNGVPNMDAFRLAYDLGKIPLYYNGDVFSAEEFWEIQNQFPMLEGVMIGRGAIKNPAIFREIHGGARLKTEELILFHNILAERYLKVLNSEVYTLHKLKEIWMYIMWNFPNEKKILKAIKKSNSLSDLSFAISALPNL